MSHACPRTTYQNEHYEWVPEPCHRAVLAGLKSLQTSSFGRHIPAQARLSKAPPCHITMHGDRYIAYARYNALCVDLILIAGATSAQVLTIVIEVEAGATGQASLDLQLWHADRNADFVA